MSPEEEDQSVVIVGLGLRLDSKPAGAPSPSIADGTANRVFVTELIAGGAAQRSNLLKFNDEILSVDHTPVATQTVVEVKNAILGTPGTSVRISIKRDNEQFELSFVRGHTSNSSISPKQGQPASAEKGSASKRAETETATARPTAPTPKALFRSPGSVLTTPEEKKMQQAAASLHDAMKSGNLNLVAKLAAEVTRKAQAGDMAAVRALLQHSDGAGGAELEFSRKSVSVLHSPEGLTFTCDVPTLQHDGASPLGPAVASVEQARARDLLALIEPLMDATYHGRTPPHVDRDRLRDLVQSVAAAAAKVQAGEPRMLEVPMPCYVLGDLHGNIMDLTFFRNSLWPSGPRAAGGDFLFLGDFVDRGADSLPVVAYMMAHKVLTPSKWFMIRGNHETREVNGNIKAYREGSFLQQCVNIFGDADGRGVWEAVNDFFDTLPLAARIANKIFCVHGGIPRELCRPGASLDLINEQACPLPVVRRGEMVHAMLWSDPVPPEREATPEVKQMLDHQGFGLSSRGCACFGERTLDIFLRQHRISHVFRGHEAQQNGIGLSRSARLCTVFSTSRDHFAPDVPTTCGALLVERDGIVPIIRGRLRSAPVAMTPPPHTSPSSAAHAAAHAAGGGGGGGGSPSPSPSTPVATRMERAAYPLKEVDGNVERGRGGPASGRRKGSEGERASSPPKKEVLIGAGRERELLAAKESDSRLFVC